MTSIEVVRMPKLGRLSAEPSQTPGKLTIGAVALAIGFLIGWWVGSPDYYRKR